MKIKSIFLTGILLFSLTDVMAQQLTSLEEIYLITDTHVSMPALSGQVYMKDDDIGHFSVNTGLTSLTQPLNQLDQAGIDGYHHADDCGNAIFSTDSFSTINGIPVSPSDVFFADGIIVLNAQDLGIPNGVNIDGLSRVPGTCEIIFSIDITANINSTTFGPSDLISWNGISALTLYQAIDTLSNVDGVHVLNSNRILLSFDVTTATEESQFYDESIVELLISESNQLLAFEPLVFDESWVTSDLSALSVKTTDNDLIFINSFEPSGFQ